MTGAGSGIGRATAELLLREGASVIAADQHPDSLEWCANTQNVAASTCDVTDEETNTRLAVLARDNFGGLDGAVLNAGVSMGGSITDLPLESCLLYTSPSPRDATLSRMPSSA